MASELGVLPDFLYERPEGTVRVQGMKLLFGGLAHQHLEGDTPEQMVEAYPSLDVGVARQIADYCERNREAVEAYLERVEREYEEEKLAHETWEVSQGIEPARLRLGRLKREAQQRSNRSKTEVVTEVAT